MGYMISSEAILAAAQADTRPVVAAKPVEQRVGDFIFHGDTGLVSGPVEYMERRYAERIMQINAGHDAVANYGLAQHGNVALAVLVSLQTDYAAWCGMRHFGANPNKSRAI